MSNHDTINVQELNTLLLGTWGDVRLQARALASSPEMHKHHGLTLADHRERTLGQLKYLVSKKAIARAYPKKYGGQDAHGASLAAFQELVWGDPSNTIKAGVQWGLFGSAVLHLGTEYHHDKWLPGILNLEIPGVYAMTETGHGSDVDAIGTTATYDEDTQEFVIHTPFRNAWKDYGGNAALHGIAAVVFAQLITKGVNHGVHAFFVPLRDKQGNFLPGIGGEDDGHKGGLNGIDNGMLHFTNVRVPRTNLLNRYGDVAEDGSYSSPIPSPGRRFFTMLGALVQGRVSLDGVANLANQAAMTIAIKYGAERRQFAGATDEEVVILDYQRHQRRLFTRLAKVYAGTFAHDKLLRKFDEVFSGEKDTDENREELETYAAALKSISTWNALDSLQEAREATGGQGYMSKNLVSSLRSDLDIFVTFEGDNNVLLQLVVKRLLREYGESFQKNPVGTLLAQFGRALYSKSGFKKLLQKITDLGVPSIRRKKMLNERYQEKMAKKRVDVAIAKYAGRINAASKKGPQAAFDAFNKAQNELIGVAHAYGEYLQLLEFNRNLAKINDVPTREAVTKLRNLFALGLLDKYSTWFLVNGYLSSGRVKEITRISNRLLGEIRPYALDLVEAFGLTDEMLRAPIARGEEAERQNEARAYYAKLRADGKMPEHEKDIRRREKTAAKK